MHKLLSIILLSFTTSLVVAQNTRILGIVRDSLSGEPLPFVNILLKGTTVGCISDFDGKFKLDTKIIADTLQISYVGYNSKEIEIKSGSFQEISIDLISKNILLNEVIIRPGENPAEVLLKKVIDNKKNNNPDRVAFYEVEAYNKMEIDANNIGEKIKDRRSMRKFQWVFDFVDTSLSNGKTFLPIFLTESSSKVYFRQNPKSKREFIEAARVSGVENESVAHYIGNLYQNINIYDNHISIFEKNFVSPIANFGLAYYKYYLVDSSFINNYWCYKIMFKPRRQQELTFMGNIWIADTSFAVCKYEMQITANANINFVNDMFIEQTFERFDSNIWMPIKEDLVLDLNVLQDNQRNALGFYGHKFASYKNYIFNRPKENNFYNNPDRTIVLENAYNRSVDYWRTARHDSLSQQEQNIYEMIDSVKKMPIFNTYIDIINMIANGYYVTGNFEIGPYASILSFNQIEGTRFRLGGRTSNAFSKKIMPSAYIAYGTKDNEFKYGGGLLLMLEKNPRKAFEVNIKHDMEQLSMSSNGFREDYFLASFLSRNPSNKLSMVDELDSYYERDWFTGFTTKLRFTRKNINNIGFTPFYISGNGYTHEKSFISTSELSLELRFAYKEKFVYGEFTRTSLGSTYPIFQFRYIKGVKGLWNSDYNYSKYNINISDWFNVGSLGWSKYIVDMGIIEGKLPYPLLKLHEGNETYFFDEMAFNTMNYFEFISDKWLSIYYTHHFDGLFMNHIPLMRKLKFREVIWAKGLIGKLNHKNIELSVFPLETHSLAKPFFEAGVGIENILKVFRIDAVWRLSHLDNPNISKFQIMFGLQFQF